MIDICHYVFVEIPKVYDTKSEPLYKLWTLGDKYVSMQVHRMQQVYHFVSDANSGGCYACVGQGYMGNL